MRVLIAGSHGLVGTALVERLEDLGHEVVRLVRNVPGDGEVSWKNALGDTDELEGFNAVVTLGGVSIGQKRWRRREKERIWDSRVGPTEQLARRFANVVLRPEVFISASAVGFYGNRADEILDENSGQGHGFLAELANSWEDATSPASAVGVRVVNLRSGIVLSPQGGALAKQLPIFKLGIGGRLGPGTQYVSWISLHDEVEAIVFAMTHRRIEGPINLTAPNPVRNAEFTEALGSALHRPTFIPAWTWMLRAGFGTQLTYEALLVSQRVVPKKLLDAGFEFRDELIDQAFEALFTATDDPEDQPDGDDVIDLETGTKSRRAKRKKKPKK